MLGIKDGLGTPYFAIAIAKRTREARRNSARSIQIIIIHRLSHRWKGRSMSFVTTQPEALTAAASSLQGIGSRLSAENAAAAAPTTGVVPAAADEVSALTAMQFSAHASLYQAMSAQAAAIHESFVSTLSASAGSYAATEAANAAAI
jgi:PE family protein